MSKAVSYYDWQQSFKDNSKSVKIPYQEKPNSLGIFENKFKDFLIKWKKDNLN